MLKALRNKANQKKIFIPLTVMVLASFSIWGLIFTEKGNNPSSALGRIDNKTVSIQDYLKNYKAVQHQVQLFYGEKANQLGHFMNLKGQAWDRILLLHYAKQQNLRTRDAEVVDWISKQFSVKGAFDEALYKRYVEYALHSNPRDFEEEVRENLTISKVSEKARAKVVLSDEELKKLYDNAHKQRDIVYGFLSWETQKDKAQTSDAELEKIYAVIKDQLTKPAEDKTQKEAKPMSFEEAKPELAKILAQENAAREAVKKLDALRKDLDASNFEELLAKNGAKTQTLNGFKPGDTPALSGISSPQLLEQALSPLKEGEISAAFAVSGGGGIARVVKDYLADEQKFKEEKEAFRKKILSKKEDEAIQNLLNTLRNQLTINLDTMKKLFPEEEQQP